MKTFLLLSTLLAPLLLGAQLTGQLRDSAGEPLSFANVILLSADTSLVTGTTTGLDGAFTLSAPTNNGYFLQFSAIGYQDRYLTLPNFRGGTTTSFDAGTITLADGAIALAALEVTAQKFQVARLPGGVAVNVGGSVLTRGSSALQVLQRAPGVLLDRRNNNLKLNGREGVTVLLNGKTMRLPLEALLTMLDGMRAENIEKIELLTSPGAKYDAEGTGGIINIVLAQERPAGFNGSLAANFGYGYGPKIGTNLQLSHGGQATYYRADYAYQYDRATDGYHGIGQNEVAALGGLLHFNFLNQVVHRHGNHQLGLGVEHQLTERTLVGFNAQISQTEDRFNTRNQASYRLPQDSAFSADINITGRNRWRSLNPGFFVETTTVSGGLLQLDANYLLFTNDNPSVINNRFADATGAALAPEGDIFAQTNNSSSQTDIRIATLQADFGQDLGADLRLEAGAKAAFTSNQNRGSIARLLNGSWTEDPRSNSQLSAREAIAAAYTSMNLALNEKNKLTAAVRYELWDQQFGGVAEDRRSGRFFPSLSFVRELADARGLTFSYARRINRPTYNDLAAALTYSGLASVFSGNPLLQPTLSQQLRAEYSFGGKFIALSWQRELGTIARFQATPNPGNDLIVISPQNLDRVSHLDLQLTVPVTFTPWWSAQLNATASWRSFRLSYTPRAIDHRYLNLGLNGNQSFTLPKDWSLELSGWFNSGDFNGSVGLKSFGALNLGVKKVVAGGAGSIQLVAEDLLKTSGVRFRYGGLGTEHYGIEADGLYLPEVARQQTIRLSYVHTLGDRKGSRQPSRRGAEEERQRVAQ